ncbi:hypothetical protein M758_UG287900 [Ceratodon purpureus]|nr:hypothetical protein M758_UG287900 [Ceratodon purpureus]
MAATTKTTSPTTTQRPIATMNLTSKPSSEAPWRSRPRPSHCRHSIKSGNHNLQFRSYPILVGIVSKRTGPAVAAMERGRQVGHPISQARTAHGMSPSWCLEHCR